MKKLILILFTLFIASTAFAEDIRKDSAWEHYITSQKKFQVAVHQLLRINHQELRKTIDKSQEVQLAQADMKSLRFYHVLKTSPKLIDTSAGFKEFVKFPWSEEDHEKLLEANKEYKKLNKRVEKIDAEINEHPDYVEMQNRLFELQRERKYTEIMARFRFVSEEIEEMLEARRAGGVSLSES